jgi:hypothetical protein
MKRCFLLILYKKLVEQLKKLIAEGNDPDAYAQLYLDDIENAIKEMNTQKFCGYDDWAIGESKEVTGKDCAISWVDESGATQTYTEQTLKSPILQYDIYKISDSGVIAFGQRTSLLTGETPDKRPKDLSFYDLYVVYGPN